MMDDSLAVLDLDQRDRSGGEMFAACMRLRGIKGTTP
jgi:hypothetical protein